MYPQIVADYKCNTGENPIWNIFDRKIYWTDIPAGRIFRYDPKTNDSEICYEGAVVGGFTIQADGALLLFGERGNIRLWKNHTETTIIDEIAEEIDTRFNDVIADPIGRVFCGTMPSSKHSASLYRLDVDGSIRKVVSNVQLSNGMAFTPDRKGFYYIDTHARSIYKFDYDQSSGEISNQRTLVQTPENDGGPDGMTVDADGYFWNARWGGGCVVRYNPEGKEERRIVFPALLCASLTFGGDDFGDIYMTAAGGQDRDKNGSGAGALFKVDMRPAGIRGVPEFHSRIQL